MLGSRSHSFFRLIVILGIGALSSCATAPKPGEFSTRELMAAACPSGFTGKRVKGSIWAKIESREMNGQFPATVFVDYPGRLAVEVTNLIGAPQAWLNIVNDKTELHFTKENEKEYGKPTARNRLGGLPLELAPRLFAGGVPCPSDDKNRDLRIRENSEGGLEVVELDLRTRDSTRYVYIFTRYAGRPWVKEVRWEKFEKLGKESVKSNPITFLREDPVDADAAPRKWSVSSSEGEIRVKWKDRSLSKSQI